MFTISLESAVNLYRHLYLEGMVIDRTLLHGVSLTGATSKFCYRHYRA